MSSVVSRPTKGSRAVLLLGALAALSFFVFLAQTGAQGTKTTDGASKKKASVKPEELYGDQGGEKVLPGNSRLPNAFMRAHVEDTFLKLSNPRIDEKGNALLLDYEVLSKGKLKPTALVLRADDGSKAEIALQSIAGRDSGTIQLVGSKNLGSFKFRTKVQLPQDVEMYAIRKDEGYEQPMTFLVSNAVVMGKMKTSTKPRDWSTEEIAWYEKGPLAYKNVNGFPDVGEDVPPLVAHPQMLVSRYVSPEGRLVGLDYADAGYNGRKRIMKLAPVFAANQPKQHAARAVARSGYAVAGAEAFIDNETHGFRLLFAKVKPDDTFDLKDSYAGDWIGSPPDGDKKATTLVNDGRRVIGVDFHAHKGAYIGKVALVADGEAKK
jgi:hypothetical protein